MRLKSAILALAMAPGALAFAVTPASTDCTTISTGADPVATSDDVIACEASVWFECSSAHGGKVHVPSSLGTGVKLVNDAPKTSFTAGGGCGQQETAQATGTATTSIYDLNATGFIAGNVDTLSVELHSIYASSLRATGTVTLDVRVVVDDQSPVGFVTSPGTGGTGDISSPESFRLEVPLQASSTRLSESMTFTITDLHRMFPQLSKAGNGSSNFHTLDVTVSVVELDWAGVFVWGATEIPANVTINGGARGLTVSAFDLKPTI